MSRLAAARELGRAVRRVSGLDRRVQLTLRRQAEQALASSDRRRALRLLLELDDRFPPDPWVLSTLADIYRQLALPEMGLRCVDRCASLQDPPNHASVRRELEAELERWHRLLARLAHARQDRPQALEHSLRAADVPEPSTWTMRVLVDTAIAAGEADRARPHLDRVRRDRPDDTTLEELAGRLDG